MAIVPRFEGGEASFSGFDKDATPRWLMVGHRSAALVFLVNGAGWVVQSHNTNIATIHEPSNNNDNRREFMIMGESPGFAFIEAYYRHSGKIPVARLLEVSVKDEMRLKIAFQFVTDSTINQTTRLPNIADELRDVLNDNYVKQTNITFTKTRDVSVQGNTSLLSIVLEQQREAGSRYRPHREWDKLVAEGDPGADINVFFMPWFGPDDKRPSQMLVMGGDFVCPDGMSDDEVKIALSHMVGLFLGCPVTYNDNQSHHLMFWRRAEGFNPHPSNAFLSFIPKDCANTMNP